MSIYLRADEVKVGALVRTMSRDNEIVPALILDVDAGTDVTKERYIRVMDTQGETYLMNTLYLERWK